MNSTDFAVSSGLRQTGNSHSVLLSNMSRSLAVKAWTQRKTVEWKDAIQTMINGDPGGQLFFLSQAVAL